mmetsp:Transcript_10988/g.19882  ORF Transcript_10988/g.19882 Transcript_10988/m.19882 type:complete len:468 (-) Transcript_10988:33-1436(-)
MSTDVERPPESKPLNGEAASVESYSTVEKSSTLAEPTLGVDPEDEFISKAKGGRAYFLDATRIFCVGLVVIDHGAPSYSKWNTLYVQNWGLQLIFLTCGASLGFSSGGYCHYMSRLSLYVLVGVLCNWTAWIATGKDWRSDPWNVVFQMWFVVGLMGYSSLLWPLKLLFTRMSDATKGPLFKPNVETASAFVGVCLLVSVCCLTDFASRFGQHLLDTLPVINADTQKISGGADDMTGFAYWFGGAQGSDNMKSVVKSLALSIRSILVVLVAAVWFPKSQAYLGWFLLFHMYGCRIASWYPAPGDRLCHGLDLVLLGLTCWAFGLKWRRQLSTWAARYWFIPLIFCALAWRPGTSVRFDSKPPEAFAMRWRMQTIEFVIITMWLLAAERWFDARIFTEDRLNFMNNWALFAFMAHKAVHIVAPPPLNWFFIVGLIPGFWFIEEKVKPWCQQPVQSDEKQPPLSPPSST